MRDHLCGLTRSSSLRGGVSLGQRCIPDLLLGSTIALLGLLERAYFRDFQ